MTNGDLNLEDYIVEAEAAEKMDDKQLDAYISTFLERRDEDGSIGEKCKSFIMDNPVPHKDDQRKFYDKVKAIVDQEKDAPDTSEEQESEQDESNLQKVYRDVQT